MAGSETVDEVEDKIVAGELRLKKCYTFGSNRHAPDAEVRTFHGTRRCHVSRFDPVGILPAVCEWVADYETAHGIAKLYALQMKAKWGTASNANW